jgi:hypothetical protein
MTLETDRQSALAANRHTWIEQTLRRQQESRGSYGEAAGYANVPGKSTSAKIAIFVSLSCVESMLMFSRTGSKLFLEYHRGYWFDLQSISHQATPINTSVLHSMFPGSSLHASFEPPNPTYEAQVRFKREVTTLWGSLHTMTLCYDLRVSIKPSPHLSQDKRNRCELYASAAFGFWRKQ